VRGIAILLQDDVDALRYALAAAHIHPSAPMMVTIFDRTIGDQLARFLPQCDVTSPADLAAPSLAGPCIQPGLLAVTRAGDLPRGIRTAGAVLDEVPVPVRARRGWRTWPMQLAGLWRSHETGTRILVAGLLGLAAVLVGDWVWLTVARTTAAAACLWADGRAARAAVAPSGLLKSSVTRSSRGGINHTFQCAGQACGLLKCWMTSHR
jgi:hypothetical protein